MVRESLPDLTLMRATGMTSRLTGLATLEADMIVYVWEKVLSAMKSLVVEVRD